MYKLIAMDLDGTLLDDNKKITKENLDTINELIKRGYEIVIATGRRYWSAKELTKEIDIHRTILANNGNIVRNSEDDKVLLSKYLNIEDFKIIVKEGRRRNLHPIIHIDGYEEGVDMIIELGKVHHGYIDDEHRVSRIEDCLNAEINKILSVVYIDSKELLHPFYDHITKEYHSIYKAYFMENFKFKEVMVEIMNPLGNKWESLKEYAKGLNIRPEEIITIGDDNNDFEMIKNSGLGIGMKNGSPLIKSVAKIITEKDNNESGVGFELKRVLDI